ncbi:hypothetical protein Vqi01_48650 [Micromonospora qiuiae]|uniref:Uncharacterized protein n=1 Tax=Micromonospora qiuiae TaxID=502268 RepID=A0ABQ4JGL5_9ACTN|nr:hypothetical protein [Micromonospora qiuiae]GIJ29703.1 hypothetical protein Vqi01_48650 [Micromonospora qiuiae]
MLDHTALLLLGPGHRFLSGLVAAPAHSQPHRHLYVPALCLADAVAERPEVGEHVLSLPAIEIVEVGFASALTIGRLVADGLPWQHAHAVATCRPDAEWPVGRPLVTAEPKRYETYGIAMVPLG